MTLSETLAVATSAGISLYASDGVLRCESLPGRVTDSLRDALKLHKAALLELLTDDPARSPLRGLIELAMVNALPVQAIDMLDLRTVVDPNVFVVWAIEQIRQATHHRMACLQGLVKVSEVLGVVQWSDPLPIQNCSAPSSAICENAVVASALASIAL